MQGKWSQVLILALHPPYHLFAVGQADQGQFTLFKTAQHLASSPERGYKGLGSCTNITNPNLETVPDADADAEARFSGSMRAKSLPGQAGAIIQP